MNANVSYRNKNKIRLNLFYNGVTEYSKNHSTQILVDTPWATPTSTASPASIPESATPWRGKPPGAGELTTELRDEAGQGADRQELSP